MILILNTIYFFINHFKNYLIMKKLFKIVLVLIFLMPINVFSQQETFNFESLNIPDTGFYIGIDGLGEFGDEDITFINTYTDYGTFGVWDNFAYTFDTVTVDLQYQNIAENAYSGNVFGIGFVPQDWQAGTYDNIPITCYFITPKLPESIFINNNKSTVNVIQNGSVSPPCDPFTNGDYFKLIIEGRFNNSSTGFIEFFLADFTEGNSIIIEQWTEIDLSSLGAVDSLLFNLESTDVGDYGMNTPAYFCLDDLTYNILSDINETHTSNFIIYPNPTTDFVNIQNIENSKITLTNISGKILFEKKNCLDIEQINLINFNSGIYFLNIVTDEYTYSKKIIKN